MTEPAKRDWEGVHTCHDECPCHTGGEPTPDFLPMEAASVELMLGLGIPAGEVAEMVMDARKRRERSDS